MPIDYKTKFSQFPSLPLWGKLSEEDRQFITQMAHQLHLSFSQWKEIIEMSRDLSMWGEPSLQQFSQPFVLADSSQRKKRDEYLDFLRRKIQDLKSSPTIYPPSSLKETKNMEPQELQKSDRPKKLFGLCPVASPKTICCHLRTIDIVEGCPFQCHYCTIQTFYGQKATLTGRLKEKLDQIEIPKNTFIHFGMGQASDSLVFGNHHHLLEDLCSFSSKHPSILMELKTKSDNIHFFKAHSSKIPKNLLISWSLNPPSIIGNEEPGTPSLTQRLKAAREVADLGIKIAFHFHPMFHYDSFQEDYTQIALQIQERFDPEEVLYISLGSVTLIKPVIKAIREKGASTKVLQMPMEKDPHGKWTYPDEIKLSLFKTLTQAFLPWKDKVFFYLCMEKKEIWEKLFGFSYSDNFAFEEDLGIHAMNKIYKNHIPFELSFLKERDFFKDIKP